MKKLILFVLCALSGLMVSAQSRWGITPEGGFAAVNRVGMGSSWRAGVKVGVGVSYQFEPGWIGLKSGLYYKKGIEKTGITETCRINFSE